MRKFIALINNNLPIAVVLFISLVVAIMLSLIAGRSVEVPFDLPMPTPQDEIHTATNSASDQHTQKSNNL